jgi:hypothetical protein
MRALLFSALVVLAPGLAHAQAPIVSQGAVPGQSIQVRDLRREPAGTLMLRMTLVNDSDQGISGVMLRESGSDASDRPSGVKLTDPATGRQYRPMRGPDGQCVCGVMPNTGKGERANLWVKFADVPATLQTASVEVKGYEPVDVPVQLAGPARLTADGGTPGQSIQVRELKRDATGAVTLRLTFINNSCCGVSSVMVREKGADGDKPTGIRLVDDATRTEYAPARQADGLCACSDMPNTGKGERANLWFRFTDVPPTLRKASVAFKTFEPVAEVPITGP